MRRSAVSTFALLVLAVAGACSDDSRSSTGLPSEPLLAKGGPNAGVCTQQQANDIEKDIKDLYGSPAAAANALFDAVQAACSTTDPDAAREPLMSYLEHTIQNPVSGLNAFMIAHWGRVFGFVGYTGIDVGSSPNVSEAVLTSAGAAAIVDLSQETAVWTGDDAAGITVRAQNPMNLGGRRLVTIEQAADNCLGTNLPTFPTCYNFGVFPHETGFSPKLLFALCAVQNTPDFPALAHKPHNEPVRVLAKVDILNCPHTPSTQSASSLVGRVLASVADLFRPRTLIAGHTGLGGEDFSASPAVPVSRQVLAADFETAGDAPGAPPTVTNFPGDAWTATAAAPGTILVQSSFGNLTDQPVVLTQAGGACKNCGGLELSANIYDEGTGLANTGRYEVHWSSLQAKPSVKEAPFLVVDGGGDVLAKVAYRTVSSQPKLYFNDQDANCAWAVNEKQDFVLTIDFTTRKTSLAISACAASGDVDFVQGNRVGDLARVGWFLTGIDAGIVGFDNLRVIRLPDNAP